MQRLSALSGRDEPIVRYPSGTDRDEGAAPKPSPTEIFPAHSSQIPEVSFAMGVTNQIAEFCANIRLASLPPEVVTRARFLVLDLVGNIVRARHDAESTASFVATVRAMGMATGNA